MLVTSYTEDEWTKGEMKPSGREYEGLSGLCGMAEAREEWWTS